MPKPRFVYLVLALVIVFDLVIIHGNKSLISLNDTLSYIAGVFFAEKIPPSQIQSEYASGTLNLLIVPGNEQYTGGTEFKNLKERDLVLELSKYLRMEFQADPNLSVSVTRNGEGGFSPWLESYVLQNKTSIQMFKTAAAVTAKYGVVTGQYEKKSIVDHVNASATSSLVLYGINKYSNDNNVNIVLHLHFNDYAGRKYNKPGIYKGFAIYIPESQLPNANTSRDLAKAIANRLKEVEPSSNFPKEQLGLIEEQDLIAVGSNGTRNGASLLIEYGYIYENKFTDPKLRDKALKDLAHATYLGIEDYFSSSKVLSVAK